MASCASWRAATSTSTASPTASARASELIAVCRQRIGDARLRIDEVIADLDGGDDVG